LGRQMSKAKEHRHILVLQSVARVWLAARLAEKHIRQHVFRTKIAKELLDTEISYCKDITAVHQGFLAQAGDVLTEEEKKILFMNISELVPVHTELLAGLQEKMRKWNYNQTVGDVVLKQVPSFVVYEGYITNYKDAVHFLQKHRASSAKLDKFLQKSESTYCRNLKLESFLIMPVQRLPRYLLLLKELRKYTNSTHPDFDQIGSAIANLESLTATLNESQREKETIEKVSEIKEIVQGAKELALESSFVFEGPLIYKRAGKGGVMSTIRKSMGSHEHEHEHHWREVFVYLFKDTLLVAKKISKTSVKTGFGTLNGKYKFSKTKHVTLHSSTVLEIDPNSGTNFTLINDDEEHEFQATTPQLRNSWVLAFEKTIISKKHA